MSIDTENLWNALTSRNAQRLVEQMRAVSSTEPQQPRNRISSAPVEGSSPTAGIGTADAGTPTVRYWTVKYRHQASLHWNYAHVIACDPFEATLVVTNPDQSISEAYVMREIDREEYEHLTRVSP